MNENAQNNTPNTENNAQGQGKDTVKEQPISKKTGFFGSKILKNKPQIHEDKDKPQVREETKIQILLDKDGHSVPENKIKELTNTLQRLQAEFENYQKRTAKQNEEFMNYANAKLIEEILPVLDSLEAGMTHEQELVRIYEQLFAVLKKQGLEKIPVQSGTKFNHDTMECMLQEKNPTLSEDAVASVLINGYTLNGKILRLVKVSVNVLEKKNPETKKHEEKNNGEEVREVK